MYSCTVSLTSVLDRGVDGQGHTPTALLPGKRRSPYCTEGGWTSGIGAENLSPTRI
jgi:hypothetical protein